MSDALRMRFEYPDFVGVLEEVEYPRALLVRSIARHNSMIDFPRGECARNSLQRMDVRHKHYHLAVGALDRVHQRFDALDVVQRHSLWGVGLGVGNVHPAQTDL